MLKLFSRPVFMVFLFVLSIIPFAAYCETAGDTGSADDFIRLFDKNGDNKVSRLEFSRPAEEFDEFDKDKNGFLEADETPKGPSSGGHGKGVISGAGMPGMGFIRKYDRTGDDKVSKKEYPRPYKEFNSLDKDSDGFIDINEAPFIPPEDGPPPLGPKGKGR
jgi:hypothetical protein